MKKYLAGLLGLFLVAATAGFGSGTVHEKHVSVFAPGAKVEKLAGGFAFTEGPVADSDGNVFFTDIRNNRIHKWSLDGELTTYRENSAGANGLAFDRKGNLVVCEQVNRRIVSISSTGEVTVLADEYDGKKLNSPNDLWMDPKGGIYFSDPRYGNRDNVEQDGEHVYYITPDGQKLIRVVDDFIRPNGVLGSPDGKVLYLADRAGNKNYVYDVNDDGTLSNKRFFSEEGSDDMTMDSEGNIYITSPRGEPSFVFAVYDSEGNRIEELEMPEKPSNVCFGGSDGKTLFITARTSLYSIRMRVHGAPSVFPAMAGNRQIIGKSKSPLQ